MTAASVTNSFSSGSVIQSSQVNQNFTDLLTFLNTTGVHVYQSGTIETAALEDGAVTPIKRSDYAIVTALSGSPVNGQLNYLSTSGMATDGVVWTFRYNSSSASSYKWEFVGGPPWGAEVATSQTTTSSTYAALATAGPSITTPLAGDYYVEHGSRLTNSTAGVIVSHSYDIGGTGAVDADRVANTPSTANQTLVNVFRRKRQNALAASTALVSKYKSDGVNTATIMDRSLHIIPIRVG